jgi:hypothetical protein
VREICGNESKPNDAFFVCKKHMISSVLHRTNTIGLDTLSRATKVLITNTPDSGASL